MEKHYKLWTGGVAVLFSLLIMSCFNAMAATSPDKTTSWIFQLYVSAKDSPEALLATKFVDEVNKKSNGRLKIKTYLAGTLGYSGTELANVCAKGAVNMVVATGQATASIDEIFSAVDLPFRFEKLTFDYDKIEPRLALIEAKPILDKHANALGLVNLGTIAYPNSLVSKKNVKTFEDWKGLKLRTYGKVISDLAKLLGASGNTVAFAELYAAMSTGVVEANISSAQVALENRLYEVCKYFNCWPIVIYSKYYFVNKNSWDALPQDLQGIVTSAANSMFREMWKEQFVDELQTRKTLESKGMTIVDIAPAEIAKVSDISKKQLVPAWLAKTGADGQQLFKIFDKYGK